MDADENEATLERVVLANGVNDTAPVPHPAALASGSSIGCHLKLQDGSQEMERALDMNEAAGSIVGELLSLDPSEVWTSVCSPMPEALFSWLWALVLGSRVVYGVSPLGRVTAACERLRRTCLGELVGLSGADSGACQSRLGSVMHWRKLSAS